MLTTVFAPIEAVNAMGECPTCCPNYYYSNFTSFFVSNGTDTINPLVNNNAEINAYTTVGYNISSTLLSSSTSASGNTYPNGTLWVNSNVYQFYGGYCVGQSVGPNESVSNNVENQLASQPYPAGQQMQFQTENGASSLQTVDFMINWIDLTDTTVSCLSPIGPSFTCSATTQNTGSPAGIMSEYYPNSTAVFTSGSSTAQCKLPGTSTNNSCSVTFEPAGTSVTATYMGDAVHSKSSATTPINPITTTTSTTTTTTSSTATSASKSSSSTSTSQSTTSTSSQSSSTSSISSSSSQSSSTFTSSISSSSSDVSSNSGTSSMSSPSTVTSSESSAPPAPPPTFLGSFGNIIWVSVGVVVIVAALLTTVFVLSRRKT